MEIAVLSDIHGNYTAFRRCMQYALDRSIKRFLFLGDYIGELAYPQKTMTLLYDVARWYDCTFIRGNKEEYWINYGKPGSISWKDENSTTGMLRYAYSHLLPANIDWFASMPISQKICIEGYEPFIICHGSPYKANEKMEPDTDRMREIMDTADTNLIVCGHTHVQGKYAYHGKTVLNAGSVGMPYGSDGKSQFLILHGDTAGWKEEFISLKYDINIVLSEMDSAELDKRAPYWNYCTRQALKDGKITHGAVLSKAMELCRMETGECIWPDIPEKYWEQAVKCIYNV